MDRPKGATLIARGRTVQGCEGFVAPPLAQAEKDLHELMRKARNKDKTIAYQEYKIASDLALKGALNLYELGKFGAEGRRVAVSEFVTRYNENIDDVETDPSLKIEFKS
jgi:hypothetical protein